MGSAGARRGTYIVPLAQVEIDGVRGAGLEALAVGSVLRLLGDPIRLGGAPEGEIFDIFDGGGELRARARRSAVRFFGPLLGNRSRGVTEASGDSMQPLRGLVLTDGRANYPLGVIETERRGVVLAFPAGLPPLTVDLFVSDQSAEALPADPPGARGGVICFTGGTLIATPDGPRPVEAIRPGDRISTRDDSAQEVLWTGSRRMSGARLYAMPHLRPVRIRAGAMGEDRPEFDLLVSPEHRMLVRGARARALFSEDEVLVAARDLIDGQRIVAETGFREVTYFHLLTERHQVIWANGMETESFHPAAADLDLMEPHQRAALFNTLPDLERDRHLYGEYARRSLSAPEAAIMRYEAA
ncbi:MAG: Hint domain-containing protein [Albidovulum sp.]|uniref:Hint domain-containing protein n=1 Tax=Albidovulum sp. TaxID=1872424 RepID=UPI003CA80D97